MKCPLNVIDQLFKNSIEGKINLSIFLVLKRAFYTVDHKILFSKLREYCAEDTSHSWFTSYLTNSEYLCYFNGPTSSKSSIEGAIPQGSCLWPLLFILYMADFENCRRGSNLNMYTDDAYENIASEYLSDLFTDFKTQL